MHNEKTGARKSPPKEHTHRVTRAVDLLSDWLTGHTDEDADVLTQALAIHIVFACKAHGMDPDLFLEGAKAWVGQHDRVISESKKGVA